MDSKAEKLQKIWDSINFDSKTPPTEELLTIAANAWKEALNNDPSRIFANKDFTVGAIFMYQKLFPENKNTPSSIELNFVNGC